MGYKIFLLFIWILLSFSPIIEAKEGKFIIDDSYFESFPAGNPFEPQLPKEETKPEVKPQSVRVEQVPLQPPPQPKPEPRPVPPVVPPPPVQPPHLEITGIVWNTARPQAIINGQVVDIGDVIADIEILGIQKAEIDILYKGQKMTVKLKEFVSE